MVKIALDAGHGKHTAGKRTPDGEREWTFNDKVLRACQTKLNEYQNVEILRLDDPSGETDVPLQARTDRANKWKADVLVSIHHNAMRSDGTWGGHGGVETFVQEKTASKASKDIAGRIHPRIVNAMGLRDRGVKTKNLHMTRESNMPAVLTEGGFMDSTTDIHALRSDTILRRQGEAIAEALAVYFKLVPKKEEVKVAAVENQKPSASLEKEYARAIKAGITDGSNPHRTMKREEGAVMALRVLEKLMGKQVE